MLTRMTLRIQLLLMVLCLVGCSMDESDDRRVPLPMTLDDGLQVGDPESQGLNEQLLVELNDALTEGQFDEINSLLVARNDVLVYEFTNLTSPRQKVSLQSVTKSVTSALVGLAVEDYGLGLDDPIIGYFPEYQDNLDWSGGKETITVEHLLTMSAGLLWNEGSVPYQDPANDHIHLNLSDDWLAFILGRPVVNAPGTTFSYNSGLSILLGEIVRRKTGSHVLALGREHLFSPMGIEDVIWSTVVDGLFQTGGGLYMSPRDMLKFGILYRNEGVWMGEIVLSQEWIEASLEPSAGSLEYGYQWWRWSYSHKGSTHQGYYAWGNGGQFIYVLPSHQLVITLAGANYDNEDARAKSRHIISKYLLGGLDG